VKPEPKIQGLTIHSPWAELVARGHKTIENRGWAPPSSMLGMYIAVHASTRWAQEAAEFIDRNLNRFNLRATPRPDECKYGIVAVTRLVGWIKDEQIVGRPPKVVAMLPGYELNENDWRWFFGPFGLVLRDTVRIEPIPCRGQQKFWKLFPETQALVRRRYLRATSGFKQAVSP
jgi:hypothetical protein